VTSLFEENIKSGKTKARIQETGVFGRKNAFIAMRLPATEQRGIKHPTHIHPGRKWRSMYSFIPIRGIYPD